MLEKSRLLRPLLFLKIQSKGLNKYRYLFPCIASLFFMLYACASPKKSGFFLIENIFEYLIIMPGFYITALSAIATFHRDSLDRPLSGEQASLKSSENGKIKSRNLSRRRFLCYLFGYLSFVSFTLYVAYIIYINASPVLFIPCSYEKIRKIADLCIQVVLIFPLFQLAILTYFSIFYLCDRIHWSDIE